MLQCTPVSPSAKAHGICTARILPLSWPRRPERSGIHPHPYYTLLQVSFWRTFGCVWFNYLLNECNLIKPWRHVIKLPPMLLKSDAYGKQKIYVDRNNAKNLREIDRRRKRDTSTYCSFSKWRRRDMLYHFSHRKYEATKNAPGHLECVSKIP